MEEKELREELQAICRFVRQTWIMTIILQVLTVAPAEVGCSTMGMIVLEFLRH